MAAGRGEFFRSFMVGLERQPVQPTYGRPQLGRERAKPGPGGGGGGGGEGGRGRQAGSSSGRSAGKNKKRRAKKGKPSPSPVDVNVSGNVCSFAGPRTDGRERGFHPRTIPPAKENLLDSLPTEVLIKILSYLDISSLFCISHVSKLFRRLANDDVMWHKIYVSEFGSQVWRPRSPDDKEVEEDRLDGHWKRMYFRTAAGREINKWRRELKETSPYTGLPRQTEWVLRNLNVSWELTVCDCFGQKNRLQQSRAYFFESSVIVRWSGRGFASYQRISTIQLHGIRKETLKSPRVRKPEWRSLILTLDMKTQHGRFIGRDRLIKLVILSPGVIIGIWRGQSNIAFIMVTLHFHKLVEKSLLGSPVCPYVEPVERPLAYDSDPEFGLHDYTLHFVLHTTGTEIMSGHFRELSCNTYQSRRGLLEFKVIDRTNLSQHRSLSGNVKLPWKSEVLEGSVENCCIMTMTLLDEFQKPFWCVSSPIYITMTNTELSFDYSGENFLMTYVDPDGQVKMKLVWLKEQKQFFLISLTVYVSVAKVNKHFSREY